MYFFLTGTIFVLRGCQYATFLCILNAKHQTFRGMEKKKLLSFFWSLLKRSESDLQSTASHHVADNLNNQKDQKFHLSLFPPPWTPLDQTELPSPSLTQSGLALALRLTCDTTHQSISLCTLVTAYISIPHFWAFSIIPSSSKLFPLWVFCCWPVLLSALVVSDLVLFSSTYTQQPKNNHSFIHAECGVQIPLFHTPRSEHFPLMPWQVEREHTWNGIEPSPPWGKIQTSHTPPPCSLTPPTPNKKRWR